MTGLIDSICRSGDPREVVLWSGRRASTRRDLAERTSKLAAHLQKIGAHCVALLADNSPDWIVVDLACRLAGIISVPLPLFFTDEQVGHVLTASGADVLITDRLAPDRRFGTGMPGLPACTALDSLRLYKAASSRTARVPPGTQKITFTSGSTGTPKGVCLSAAHQLTVADSLATAVDIEAPRHLCVLPLSTLLENVAGVYTPLLRAGTVVVPPLAGVGLTGSSHLEVATLLECIARERPHSLILVPDILGALTTAAEGGWRPPSSLRFVAVGGGKVSTDLLSRAARAGLPVYEGYGLSECGSVVALNLPSANVPGSAGRPLPHVETGIENGEIVVRGSSFLGYLGEADSWGRSVVRTGDLGRIDTGGYVHIDGRVKNQLITGFGRNVSPEWVESELLSGPLLHQAVVLGDARPRCVALLWPHTPAVTDAEIDAWIGTTNRRLPDYARVTDWRRLPGPMTSADGLVTTNGRPRRNEIETRFGDLVEPMYTERAEAMQ